MAFKYRGGDRTSEDVSKRAKMSGGSYDSYLSADAPFFKAREGENTIRVMPPTWDDKKTWGNGWEIVVWLHRNVGPDNGTYLCLDKMKGEECPICEARRSAVDDEEADALRVQPRPICYIIDRDSEKSGPQIMGMPMTLFRDINTRSVDKKTGDLILIDGDKDGYGYDVMFNREGTDKRTKYAGVEIDREETPLCDDKKKEDRWLDFIEDHPLPDMLVFYDAEHINKVLYGKTERRKGSEDEEEERPRGRRGRSEPEETERPRRGRGREDEKEETEERPRRGRGREDEKEEETAEERPRRGRRGEPEEETERPRRGRREEAEEPEGEERSRRGRREEPEEETDKPRGGSVERRRSAPAEEAEETESDSPSRQARGKLEGLKNRRR